MCRSEARRFAEVQRLFRRMAAVTRRVLAEEAEGCVLTVPPNATKRRKSYFSFFLFRGPKIVNGLYSHCRSSRSAASCREAAAEARCCAERWCWPQPGVSAALPCEVGSHVSPSTRHVGLSFLFLNYLFLLDPRQQVVPAAQHVGAWGREGANSAVMETRHSPTGVPAAPVVCTSLHFGMMNLMHYLGFWNPV